MDTYVDKRPFYIWILVLLTNIEVFVVIALIHFAESVAPLYSFSGEFLSSLRSYPLFFLLPSLLITAGPVLIARSSNKWKNYFGYGIPTLLFLLTFLVIVYTFFLCSGKFCGLALIILGVPLLLAALISTFFYIVGIYGTRWNVRFIVFLIRIEMALPIIYLIYVLYNINRFYPYSVG